MTWPKGGKGRYGVAYTGRRVSSLVPWGDSEESETVKVSQDVVNRRGEGGWEGEGVGEGAGGKEEEREKAREQAREKAREQAREETGKEKGGRRRRRGGGTVKLE